jgi:hypothetical protein
MELEFFINFIKRSNGDMTPYDVCTVYAEMKDKKKLVIQTYQEKGIDMVLIEGEDKALEFLGKILLAHSKYKEGCGFEIGPKSAGNVFFNKKKSTHGLYIHRLPCLEEPGKKLSN